MLFLLFDLDGDRYALDAREIVEVLALRPVRPVPGAPVWVAGVAERHGAPLPVVDVPRLALGRPARQLLSTRLVIVRYDSGENDAAASGSAPLYNELQQDLRADPTDGSHDGPRGNPAPEHLLGLIVESATQTRRIGRAQFADTGLATPHARWLGPVANDGGQLVQWVQVQHMLNDDVKALLFPQAAPTREPTSTP
jgi:chemotaxis-related protein WspB